jgi:formyltetrahydrofolate deformylase
MNQSFLLTLSCPDRKGIVAAVANFLAGHDASIVDSSQFNDATSDRFFMRVDFVSENGMTLEEVHAAFAPIARIFRMEWTVYDKLVKPKLLIAVSMFGHCLYDLIHRARAGILPAEIVGVVSNHDDMRAFVEWSGIPFHRLPEGKAAQEASLLVSVVRTIGTVEGVD